MAISQLDVSWAFGIVTQQSRSLEAKTLGATSADPEMPEYRMSAYRHAASRCTVRDASCGGYTVKGRRRGFEAFGHRGADIRIV